MFDQIEAILLGSMQSLYDQFGWGGVIALTIFENATGITPSEIVLGFAGWMLISSHGLPASFIWLGSLYAAAGSTIGASLTYWAARLGGRPFIERLAVRLRLNPGLITATERHFERWGAGIVLGGRVIPGIRTLVSIPAGLARMPFQHFLAATFIGTYFWCALIIGTGYILGHEWSLISETVRQYLPYLIAAAAAGAVLFWIRRSRQPLETVQSNNSRAYPEMD